jgi:hypothetical protein
VREVLRRVSGAIVPIAVGLLVLAGLRYFFPLAPAPPTGQINCTFQLAPNAPPARSAYSSVEVSRIEASARLTGRSEEHGIALWHAEGTAKLADQSMPLSGFVFLKRDRTVTAIGLWQDPPGHEGDELTIWTLNKGGMLDSDEATAYVRFKSDSNKLGHPFRYKCKAAVPA